MSPSHFAPYPLPPSPLKSTAPLPFLLRSAKRLHRWISRTGLPYTCPRTGVLRLTWICCPLLPLPLVASLLMALKTGYIFTITTPIWRTIALLESLYGTTLYLPTIGHAALILGMLSSSYLAPLYPHPSGCRNSTITFSSLLRSYRQLHRWNLRAN